MTAVDRVAIMQPTFLPWLGYFAMMHEVDLFVLLDTVQFDRRSWQQRNRLKLGGGGTGWATVPVKTKGRREQTINQVEIDYSQGFPDKLIRTIELSYTHTPFYREYSTGLMEILGQKPPRLVDLTEPLIVWLKEQLGIGTPLKRSAELEAEGKKEELLASLCREVGAQRYLSPMGARGYLENSSWFRDQGIDVAFFEFNHPNYPQDHGKFVPHLSVLDLLFNVGRNGLAVIEQGLVRT